MEKNIHNTPPNLKERIDLIKFKKHLSFTGLSEKIGITKTALFNSFDRNDFKLSTLYKISNALEVNILELLMDEEGYKDYVSNRNGVAHNVVHETAELQNSKMQVNYLEQLLKSKEDRISDLKSLIVELRKKD